jgi:quinol monooxygenase YgiN
VLLPKDDDTKVFSFEMYRDADAFEVHLNGPSLAQLRKEIAGTAMKLHGVRCTVVD